MCVARTARRRRVQAKNGYNHLAKLGRPIYSKPSASKQTKRLQKQLEKQRLMAARKGASGKGG